MSTTTINFTLTDASNNPVDADSTPLLRDPSAAFGIKRNDNSAIVVTSGTAMVRDSTGVYHCTFTDPTANLTYTYAIEYVYDGEADWLNGTKAGATGEASWYYADQQAVLDLLGSANLKIESDLSNADANPDDAITDDEIALILRDGQDADAWFNTQLRGGAYVVPIAVGGVALTDLDASNETRRLFRRFSAMQVAIYLNDHRAIQSISGSTDQKGIDALMKDYQKQIDEFLEGVRDGDYQLLADGSTTEQGWRAGGDATAITPSLHNNDVNRMNWRNRAPDAVPIYW